jgi:hypothetical protein
LGIGIAHNAEKIAKGGTAQTEAQCMSGGRENHAGHWGLRQGMDADVSANMSVVNSSNPDFPFFPKF